MTVNGVPKLTCSTFLSEYAPGPVRVEPMRHFPILRDLVVDTSDFLVKLGKSKPWIIRKVEKPLDEEYFQTPEQLDAYKQFSMCINCMLCYAACPVYGLDPLFSGPAAIALAQRYNLTPGTRGPVSASISSPITTEFGDARLSASARRFVPKMWTPPVPFSSTS